MLKRAFSLVPEYLRGDAERGLLLTTLAPHLVKPLMFIYPLKGRGWERLYAGSGVALFSTTFGPAQTAATRLDALRVASQPEALTRRW